MKKILLSILIIISLNACQTATPFPRVLITENMEFTLAPNQEAVLVDSGLYITLLGVTNDARCPWEIECAESGPVSVSLSVQVGDEEASEIQLQTFTNYEGRAPSMQFEGIETSVSYEGYIFRITGVSPYPNNLEDPIQDADYRVSLVVSK